MNRDGGPCGCDGTGTCSDYILKNPPPPPPLGGGEGGSDKKFKISMVECFRSVAQVGQLPGAKIHSLGPACTHRGNRGHGRTN